MNRTLAARVWGSLTLAIGAALLTRPEMTTALVSRGASTPNPAIVRILGGRQLLQGAAVLARPRQPLVLIGGSVIDMLHSASMVAAAAGWPRYRRPALASAVVAGASAVAGLLISRRP